MFPHAPQRPVTINNGWVMPAWYDIRSLARTPDREDARHIAEAAGMIQALIAREVQQVPSSRLALLGFSQGAAMSLHVGLRHPERLAGVGVLSGYLVVEDTVDSERNPANADTSFFFGHGARDAVVPIAKGRASRERLEMLGYPTEWVERPRMGHEVDPEEIAALGTWLQAVLPPQ